MPLSTTVLSSTRCSSRTTFNLLPFQPSPQYSILNTLSSFFSVIDTKYAFAESVTLTFIMTDIGPFRFIGDRLGKLQGFLIRHRQENPTLR